MYRKEDKYISFETLYCILYSKIDRGELHLYLSCYVELKVATKAMF